jgi:hypothetical protein
LGRGVRSARRELAERLRPGHRPHDRVEIRRWCAGPARLEVEPDSLGLHRGGHAVVPVPERIAHLEPNPVGGQTERTEVHGELVEQPKFSAVDELIPEDDRPDPLGRETGDGKAAGGKVQ